MPRLIIEDAGEASLDDPQRLRLSTACISVVFERRPHFRSAWVNCPELLDCARQFTLRVPPGLLLNGFQLSAGGVDTDAECLSRFTEARASG